MTTKPAPAPLRFTQAAYCVRVELRDGTLAVLTHRNRCEWTKQTAAKHCADVLRQIKAGERPGYRHAFIQEC